jgi:MoxR-like ATPase
MERKHDDFAINTVVDAATVTQMQSAIENVHGDNDILHYITSVVRETRKHAQVEVGASPRGSLALLKLARANAAFNSRDYIIPDDVKDIAVEALAHRIIPKASSWVRGFDSKLIIEEVLDRVPVPRVD